MDISRCTVIWVFSENAVTSELTLSRIVVVSAAKQSPKQHVAISCSKQLQQHNADETVCSQESLQSTQGNGYDKRCSHPCNPYCMLLYFVILKIFLPFSSDVCKADLTF